MPREAKPPAKRHSVGRSASVGRSRGKKSLLCTLGPSSLNPKIIPRLEAAGVAVFRINMSHTDLGDLSGVIDLIQSCTGVPICLDTEGAQIRTGIMRPGTLVEQDTTVRLVGGTKPGDSSTIPLRPGSVVPRLEEGARVSVDFDSVVLRVDRVSKDAASATVLVGGEIGTRKAVTALPSPILPTFSEKDLQAIRIGLDRGIRLFALSFCEHASAVVQLRELVGPDATVIAKVESREGVRNLREIARSADSILIDRGDLSRQVRLEAIPLLQKAIIREANAAGTPVYVATNLLESMVTRRAPTRAEVNDVINTLLDGADGLVLAAETAIGKYPVEAAQMVGALLREYEGALEGYGLTDLLGEHPLARHGPP